MVLRLGIAGIRGRMGREIAALAASDPEITLAGGVSRANECNAQDPVPIVDDPAALLPDVDVLIDFTCPDGVVSLAKACASARVPLVTGTTGLSGAQTEALRAAARQTPVFRAANMSPGVNAVLAILPLLTRSLGDYDVEIVETHHRHKVDAPSGTALALARAIAGEGEERFGFGRHGVSPRGGGEIGIHAVRGGGNPGEHVVIFASDGEEVRVSHRAFNRAAYAQGALRAAKLLAGVPPGWYEPTTLPGFL